jgi:inhibitor of cysteine peptidase
MVIELTQDQSGRAVEMAVGDELLVKLAENRTTGYRWDVRSDGSPACTTLNDEAVAGRRPGEAGIHIWRFAAVATGQATIDIVHKRTWEQQGVQEFTLSVTVTPAK